MHLLSVSGLHFKKALFLLYEIFFVALDADKYEIDAEKISLSWGQTISDWLNKMQEFAIDANDVVVGHSVGATVAVLNGKGRIIALSPSPITEDTKHLIVDVDDNKLPFIEEGKKHFLKRTGVKVYVGENENEIIKESARVLANRTGGILVFVPGADHLSIVERTKDKWVSEIE